MGRGRRLGIRLWLIVGAVIVPGSARGSAEVKLDREFLAGLVEKLPAAPFARAGQYRGSARGFRLVAIDPMKRRFVVACEVSGEFRPPVAGAIRRAVTPPSDSRPPPSASPGDEPGWKAFTFDVRASIFAEPGPDGVPRFRVDVDEVKRRELDGVAGALARVLGRYFDGLVTQVADGRAESMNAKLNETLRAKVAAFKEYGVLREIAYQAESVTLTFDVTKFRSEGIAGYVYPTAEPGTVALHRWVRPGLNDRFYTTSPQAPAGHPYYVYESIACYVLPTPRAGTVPFHRWRSLREWYYTTDDGAGFLPRLGYRPEMVACHLFPVPTPGAVPLYRFVDPRTGVHFYTTHPHAEFAK